eukprot:13832064-Alexandrium_andersonii.AAC.1
MDFRRKRIAQAGGVARWPCPRLAPKAKGLRHAPSLVPAVDKLWFPAASAEGASSPSVREASGPPAPGA